MNLVISTEAGRAQISITGMIDEVGAKELEQHMIKLDMNSTKEVILDFDKVEYIGSAGIGVLLLFYKRLAMKDGKIAIKRMQKDIFDLMSKEMNLSKVFQMSRK